MTIPAHLITATRVANHYRFASSSLDDALVELKKFRAWARGFDLTLSRALQDDTHPVDHVWQEELVEFWAPFDPIERRLLGILERIEEAGEGLVRKQTVPITRLLDPPPPARIETAIRNPKFFDSPSSSRARLAYPVRDLQAWHQHFKRWVETAIDKLSTVTGAETAL